MKLFFYSLNIFSYFLILDKLVFDFIFSSKCTSSPRVHSSQKDNEHLGSAVHLAVYVSICWIGEEQQLNSGHSRPEAFSRSQSCLPFMIAILPSRIGCLH